MTVIPARSPLELAWSPVDSFTGNFTADALTAQRACPICGGLAGRTVLTLDGFQFYADSREAPKRVDLVQRQCDRCFAVYLHGAYTPYAYDVLFAQAEQLHGALPQRADEEVAWMREHGLLAPGTELLDVGIEFVHGDFETFAYDRQPHAITMLHVLEHLPRPVEALAKLRSIAHEGTRLVVEVPILELATGEDVTGALSEQHTTHFTRTSLRGCLARAGWEPVVWHEADDHNGCRVVAAPAAPTAPHGDRADRAILHRYLARWYATLARIDERLERVPPGRTLVWGAGLHTEWLYRATSFFAERERTYVLVDRDPFKQGTSWRGIPVYAPEEIETADFTNRWCVCSSYRHRDAFAREAVALGIAPERIVTLYDA